LLYFLLVLLFHLFLPSFLASHNYTMTLQIKSLVLPHPYTYLISLYFPCSLLVLSLFLYFFFLFSLSFSFLSLYSFHCFLFFVALFTWGWVVLICQDQDHWALGIRVTLLSLFYMFLVSALIVVLAGMGTIFKD